MTHDGPMTQNRVSVPAPSVRALLAWSSEALGSEPEARWIVASATGQRVGELAVRADVCVAPVVFDAVQDMVNRRLSGEPLQYVLGTWAFRTVELRVDRRVLIPRPETEQVVSAALDELRMQARGMPEASRLVAVDLGTGSGAIGLSLAAEWESPVSLEVWATDASPGASGARRGESRPPGPT